jgi:hypothetical protein
LAGNIFKKKKTGEYIWNWNIIIIYTNGIGRMEENNEDSYIHATVFYCLYQKMFADDVLTNCEFITHKFSETASPNDEKRFEQAEELINCINYPMVLSRSILAAICYIFPGTLYRFPIQFQEYLYFY